MPRAEHTYIFEIKALKESINQLRIRLDNGHIMRPLYNDEQFSELIGVSKKTLQIWRKNNIVSYSKVCNTIIYRYNDIMTLLEENYVKKKN